jgi:hypothetical protein
MSRHVGATLQLLSWWIISRTQMTGRDGRFMNRCHAITVLTA